MTNISCANNGIQEKQVTLKDEHDEINIGVGIGKYRINKPTSMYVLAVNPSKIS